MASHRPPQKPTNTPAPASRRIAACVIEVPVPSKNDRRVGDRNIIIVVLVFRFGQV